MRNLKKFLALVLAMMMTLSLMVTVNAASDFTDKDTITENFSEAVEVLEGMGVFKGYTDGSFQPKGNISRAEVATIVYRLATGDAEGKQAHLYASGAAKFGDVASDHWALGEIGYCANNLLVLGYDETHFGPSDNVTGVQALAMILRAVGYGKNNEFKGYGWDTNVYGVARGEGLLKNVDNTNYTGRLSQDATRELVAELLFQAAQIPTVNYQYGSYNKYTTTVTVAGVPKEFNPSLGYRYYGLTKDTGIVLGNQATGEDDTLIGFAGKTGVLADGDPSTNEFIKNGNGSYAYDSAADTNITVPFDAKTGLDMFGHKADVWYDGRDNEKGYTIDANDAVEQDANKTYAIFDKAVLAEYVYAEDGIISDDGDADNSQLGAAAIEAGFEGVELTTADDVNDNAKAMFSKVYTRINDTTAANITGNESPVNMYYLVSNNNGKTVDVAVTLSAEVGQITEKNTTAKTQYLTLGKTGATGNNVSTFHNGTAGQIHLKKLTPDSVQKLGELVTAWEVQGTTKAAPAAADFLYQLDAMKTVTKQVRSFTAEDAGTALDTDADAYITELNFTDGTSMKLSGITLGDKTNSEIITRALPIAVNMTDTDIATANGKTNARVIRPVANKDYTVYVDVMGRFISLTTSNDVSFLYATFADFQMGALGEGVNKYAITGVDKDGNIVANHDLTAIYDIADSEMKKIVGNLADTYSDTTNLPITKKDYSSDSNQILDGANTGFMITKDGQITPFAGKTMNPTYNATTDPNWVVKTSDVSLGVAKVVSNSVEYLLTENTQFYVVEGSGTATLKVTPYKGIKAFLGDSSSVEIDASSNTIDDQVVFWTEEDMYGTVNTDSNHNVAKVILSDTNLTRWGGSSMFYSFNADEPTGLTLPGAGADVAQFELYANGEKGTYFIDTAKSLMADNSKTWKADNAGKAETDTFYTLTQIDEVNGTPIYRAVGIDTSAAPLAYADGLNTSVDYKYIAVNNLNFAQLEKTNKLIFNVGSAKICDAEWNDGTLAAKASVKSARSEIKTLAELNNAISVMKPDMSGPVYTTFKVAVVYDNTDVATIYITQIA